MAGGPPIDFHMAEDPDDPQGPAAAPTAVGPTVYVSIKKQQRAVVSVNTFEKKEKQQPDARKKKPKAPKEQKPIATPLEGPITEPSPSSSPSALNAEATPFDPSASPPAEPSKAKPRTNLVVERKPVERPKPKKKLTAAEETDLEIAQLKIKLPDLTAVKKSEHILLEMTAPVLDPEFPYDLESIRLACQVPIKGYPNEVPLTFDLLNAEIPSALKARFKMHMDKAARSLLGQQALRPMIRFLEKNLEFMLTPPANPSGFKFVAPTVAPSPAPSVPRVIEAPKGAVEYMKSNEDFEMPSEYYEALKQLSISPDSSSIKHANEDVEAPSEPQSLLPLKQSRFKPADRLRIEPISKGSMSGAIQLRLHGLKTKNVGLLVITQLGVLMRCDRCKVGTAIDDLRPDVDRIYACKKCSSKATMHFKFEPVHAFNSSAGYLRCKGGAPVDMLPSNIQVTCSQCSPDDPLLASVKVEKVQNGEMISFSCRSCYSNGFFSIGHVDWLHLQNAVETGRPKRGTIPKLPSQIGEPLPENGTCKHYRKSFRWFRFPCCGKAYPCDTCHDEDPSNAGHKAEWATRMICGACSREMSVSQKECPCGAEPANTRRSAHWEGGKGMRDQTLMSKKDSKKYRNLTKPKPTTS